MGDSLWSTRDQQRGSGSVEALRQQPLVPSPHTGALLIDPQLGTPSSAPQTPSQGGCRGTTVPRSLSQQKAGVQVGSARAGGRSTLQAQGPRAPPLKESWPCAVGCLPFQRWCSGWEGHGCRPCVYCLVPEAQPSGPIHPGVQTGEDRCALAPGKVTGQRSRERAGSGERNKILVKEDEVNGHSPEVTVIECEGQGPWAWLGTPWERDRDGEAREPLWS